MDELDVMVRTAGPIPRQRSAAGCGATRTPDRPGAAPVRRRPQRAARSRACLVPPGTGRAPGPFRSRTERVLIGVATVLCSAVVVVVLGLVAEASAGRDDLHEPATPVPSAPAWGPAPDGPR